MKTITLMILAAIGIVIGYQVIKWIKEGRGLDIITIIFVLISSIGLIAFYNYVAGEPHNV